MKSYKRSKYYNKPLRLSKKQRKNPHAVLRDFFTWYHLDDFRQILSEWLEVAITTDCEQFETPRDRSNLLFFAGNLEVMAEAAYILIRKELPPSFRNATEEIKQSSQ